MLPKPLFLLCYILLSIGLASCENDIKKIKLVTEQNKLPAESAKNIEIIYSDSASVKAKIMAPRLNHFITADPYVEMPEGINGVFYNSKMQETNRLTANYAIKYESRKTTEARGNVIAINEKGDQLNTEKLIWDELKQKIYSDQFVKITTKDEIIYGKGFESDQNFTHYKIFNIKGIINVNKDAPSKDS